MTSIAENMAAAAGALIDSFSPEQRATACWEFPSDSERRLWFFTPTDHGGISLDQMTSAQHRRVHQLLATALSAPGYMTAANIMGRENMLDYVEGFKVSYGRDRGRDPMLYFVSIFGDPAVDTTWSWRFGGHHLSIHPVIVDGVVVSTSPIFMGADPANAPLLGPHMDRPLAGAEDFGRELIRSFDESQRAEAVVSAVPPVDIVGANRTQLSEGDQALSLPEVWRGRFEDELDQKLAGMQRSAEESLGLTADHLKALAFTRKPKGIAAADLSADQQEVFRTLLEVYVGRLHDDLADEQWAKVNASFNALHFLWAGSFEAGKPHYYRIQGGDLFVEYDNTAREANHLHSVWRDLSLDFGRDPLAEHYSHGHTH